MKKEESKVKKEKINPLTYKPFEEILKKLKETKKN